MIDVDVDLDTHDLDRGLDKAFSAMVHPRIVDEVARKLKSPMRKDIRHHGQERESSDGRLWPSRKRIEGRGKKALRRNRRKLLGKLPSAVTVTARAGVVTAQSRAKWAAIHQTGGRGGRGARVPRREFLWISDGLMTHAAEVLRDHVLRAFGGA